MFRGGGGPFGVAAITGGDANNLTTLSLATGAILSGSYTPTLTNTTNITGSSAALAYYLRIGNIVQVAGTITIDPTAASTPSLLRISLPVASTIGAVADVGGVGSCLSVFGLTGGINGAVGAGTAALNFVSDAAAGNVAWAYTFTYIVH